MSATSNRSYPLGIPFRQPQAAPRPGILALGLGALALVVVTAGGTMLLLTLTAPRPQATAPSNDRPSAETREPESKPGKVAPLAKTERERYLAALGLLSAAQVYQTYLNIGLLADGVESGAYSKVEAEEMLATVAGLVNQMDRQLDKIGDTGLDTEDQQNVERIQTLTVLLRRQASALRAYWATGEREQIDRYHQTREMTWKHLSAVLDIE